MKSGNLNFLEPSVPLEACNGTALPLPYCFYVKEEWPLDYLENYSGTLTFPTRSGLISRQLLLVVLQLTSSGSMFGHGGQISKLRSLLMRHLYFYIVSSDRLIFCMMADSDLGHCLNGYPFNRLVSQGCEQCPL
jgi:hypothetical protein